MSKQQMTLREASLELELVKQIITELVGSHPPGYFEGRLGDALNTLDRVQQDYFKPLYASRPKHPPTVPKVPVRKVTLVGLAAPADTSRPLGGGVE